MTAMDGTTASENQTVTYPTAQTATAGTAFQLANLLTLSKVTDASGAVATPSVVVVDTKTGTAVSLTGNTLAGQSFVPTAGHTYKVTFTSGSAQLVFNVNA
jgi:hypothetical protein